MKKVTTILTATVMLFSALAFASEGDVVNNKVKAAFLSDFTAASNVSWKKTNDYYFATFFINQIEVNAAYNETGELVGTSRVMESTQLPISISMALAKKYTGYSIAQKAIELTYEGETRYYLTIANDRQSLDLKCTVNGNIEVEKKIRKK